MQSLVRTDRRGHSLLSQAYAGLFAWRRDAAAPPSIDGAVTLAHMMTWSTSCLDLLLGPYSQSFEVSRLFTTSLRIPPFLKDAHARWGVNEDVPAQQRRKQPHMLQVPPPFWVQGLGMPSAQSACVCVRSPSALLVQFRPGQPALFAPPYFGTSMYTHLIEHAPEGIALPVSSHMSAHHQIALLKTVRDLCPTIYINGDVMPIQLTAAPNSFEFINPDTKTHIFLTVRHGPQAALLQWTSPAKFAPSIWTVGSI